RRARGCRRGTGHARRAAPSALRPRRRAAHGRGPAGRRERRSPDRRPSPPALRAGRRGRRRPAACRAAPRAGDGRPRPLRPARPPGTAGRAGCSVSAGGAVGTQLTRCYNPAPLVKRIVASGKARARLTRKKPVRAKEPPEAAAARARRAVKILDILEKTHPEARCALDYRNPFQLAVATILSAQCTDERVNMVTPALFARFPTPAALAQAPPAELEEIIRSTGFFRAKAKSLLGFAKALVERGGELPRTVAEAVKLPGVGRKTANVVLGHAYGVNEGIAVDTHVL